MRRVGLGGGARLRGAGSVLRGLSIQLKTGRITRRCVCARRVDVGLAILTRKGGVIAVYVWGTGDTGWLLNA